LEDFFDAGISKAFIDEERARFRQATEPRRGIAFAGRIGDGPDGFESKTD